MFTRMKTDKTMMNEKKKRRRQETGEDRKRGHKETVGICEDGTSEAAEDGLGGLF